MSLRELAWRSRAAARIALDHARCAIARPCWRREQLANRLVAALTFADGGRASATNRAAEVHRALASHFAAAPQRFLIAPALRTTLGDRVRIEYPDSPMHAQARAEPLVAGMYDILGYRRLQFGTEGRAPDWHYDPVHRCRAPARFWRSVPYLDPAYCGDHKIIWELSRHQHWLALGRAYWLTGNPKYRQAFIDELTSWLVANPPLIGINWASMLELAMRSLSWIWALNFFVDTASNDSEPWIVDLLLGLDQQLSQIERNLSYYFSPNTHLIGEAAALYVAGRALPELKASPRRAALGRRILVDEISRQITGDGGHVERSTHYHRYTLDFYLLALIVARVTSDPIAPVFEEAANRLAGAARLLADEGGLLPHIGDDDGGSLWPICGRPPDDIRDSLAIAARLTRRPELQLGRSPEECWWALAHPLLAGSTFAVNEASRHSPAARSDVFEGFSSRAMPETGYYVSRSPSGGHLVIDAGPFGHQNGGHAHADALSLTLAVHGMPFLIDPGTYCYTTNPALRDRFRSTALHNTLVLDDRSQSIPLGPFHWSQTAQAGMRRWRTNARFDYFEGVQDGYAPVEHRRHLFVLHDDLLIVADLVDGPGTHTAAVHWHLDDRWRVDVRDKHIAAACAGVSMELVVPSGTVSCFRTDAATGLGWSSPVYGRIEAATTVRILKKGALPIWIVTAIGLDPDNPISGVDDIPVWAEAGRGNRSTAIRVRRASSTDYFLLPHRATRPETGKEIRRSIAECETDAHMLFYRLDRRRSFAQIGIVDGSRLTATARQRLALVLGEEVPDLHIDFDEVDHLERAAGRGTGRRSALVHGSSLPSVRGKATDGRTAMGIRLIVDDRELSLTEDRRIRVQPRIGPRTDERQVAARDRVRVKG